MSKMILDYREGPDGMLYPDLIPTKQTNYPIGKYGKMRQKYLKEHRRGTYTTLLTEFRLNDHLHEIEVKAKKMLSMLIKQMAKSRGVNEQMKATDQMRWVQEMNNCKACAEETVREELIFA